MNRIVGLGVRVPAPEKALDEALEFMASARIRKFMVPACPLSRPSSLPTWLEARGLIRGTNWVKLIRGNQPPPAVHTDLRSEKMERSRSKDFARLVLGVFSLPAELELLVRSIVGRPGWRSYCALDGERLVSAGALYVQGSAAWLGFAATHPDYRNAARTLRSSLGASLTG